MNGQADDVEDHEATKFDFLFDGVTRNKHNPEPGHNGLFDCFVRPHFSAQRIEAAGDVRDTVGQDALGAAFAEHRGDALFQWR